MNQKHIAFVGDSFCAAVDIQDWKNRGRHRWQVGTETPAWPSLVAKKLDLVPHYHGYCGKSWWYSRHWFFERCKKLLDNNQIDIIVFCHTDPTRINHLAEPLVNVMPDPETAEEEMLKKAQDLWRGYLYDETFARWCQNNWLLEIKNKFQHVPKIIQFASFYSHLFDNSNYSGMCFRTPLVNIQAGEYIGTTKEIQDQMSARYIPNHFNEHNNQAMANVVIDAINNYCPGLYEINTSRFDIVNPNWINYPEGDFGTRL